MASTDLPSATTRLLAVEIPGPAGRLEGLVNAPDAEITEAPFCALVCHPHPPSGGTLHNKVVYNAMKALTGLGLTVLRINFRGTGRSEGTHDLGRGEVDDVKAAIDWLQKEFGKPVVFAGFSFGSNVGLRACCGDARVLGIIALGVPMHAAGRDYTYRFLPGCVQPKLFVSGTRDEFASEESVEALVTSSPNSSLVWVDQADHFFTGKLDQVRMAIADWVKTKFLVGEQPTSDNGNG
jgi:alpha/beta superfamily hydrolase